jgi:hypothetical protein
LLKKISNKWIYLISAGIYGFGSNSPEVINIAKRPPIIHGVDFALSTKLLKIKYPKEAQNAPQIS